MAQWLPNLYFDLSIGQLSCLKKGKFAIKQNIKNAYEEGSLNADKLLYGSDCFIDVPEKEFLPRITWSLSVIKAELELLRMSDKEKKMIMAGNAEKLLGRK